MLSDDFLFNYKSIRSFTSYSCTLDEQTAEKEISLHVDLGPSTERNGDVFPVYEIPEGKMASLSDWSFNGGWILSRELAIGGSLGRITPDNHYIYVLNCAVFSGEMEIYSPARPVRYLPGEWIAVCFHQIGKPMDIQMRATFRFTESTTPDKSLRTTVTHWEARNNKDLFGPRIP